jgi:hypothetical protein
MSLLYFDAPSSFPCWKLVFAHLTPSELATVSAVCREFFMLTRSNDDLWQPYYDLEEGLRGYLRSLNSSKASRILEREIFHVDPLNRTVDADTNLSK